MHWRIVVHDGNRTVRRARREAETRTALCRSLMALQASYIELQHRLGGGQSHWTRECQCPSASGTEQLGRSAKVMVNVGHFPGRS